jgi:dienelactone hydrolase
MASCHFSTPIYLFLTGKDKVNSVKILLLVGLLLGSNAFAKDVKVSLSAADAGEIWFSTLGSMTKPAVKGGLYTVSKESISISGELRFPPGDGPFPAVILVHGCGGKGDADPTWVPVLTQWGYATFVVDSFGPRKLSNVCDDPWRLIPLERVPDVYGALRLISTHPKIDPNAVALMGFSMGGILTANAATVWAKNLYVLPQGPRFRAFFPFYPYCNSKYPEREEIYAPMRIHTGASDDWTPAGPCQEWTDRLKANGFDASTTTYPGAQHAFDTAYGTVVKNTTAFNGSRCTPVYPSIMGPFDLAKNFSSSCASKGATVGRSPKAIEMAQAVLKEQPADLLHAK